MNGILGGKIVTGRACNALGMPTFRVHQTDYPEIEAEGQTPAAARGRLIELLVQAHDFASEAWRYRPLALALIDARAFNGSFTAGEWTEPRRSRLPSMETDPSRRPPVGIPKSSMRSPSMERLRGQLMDGDRVLFDEIEGSIAIEEGPGLQEWRGRLWLPDGAQVRPGDRYCLIREDRRDREPSVESSGPRVTG